MPTDADAAPGFDAGLLSPVSVGRDALVSDTAYAAALVRAEVALAQVLGGLGVAPRAPVEAFLAASKSYQVDVRQLALDAVADGNPVIPLVKRLRALVEVGPPGVVLEAGQRAPGPGAVQEDVADHAAVTGDGLVRQQPDPGQVEAARVVVAAAEELVAAEDGEERGIALHGLAERLRLLDEVLRHQRLLAVLAAADVEEVDLPDRDGVAHPDRADVQLVPARACAFGEDGDVAAVGVDVQVVRIEMADADDHAAVSQ